MELQYRLLLGPCVLINKEQIPTSYSVNIRILLVCQAGADPQCMDSRRNTPLHIIVTYQVLYGIYYYFPPTMFVVSTSL
jgi:hypothetical protein